ncbi:hypothetical protein ACTFIW_010448 [Dictyostelium discoideum]
MFYCKIEASFNSGEFISFKKVGHYFDRVLGKISEKRGYLSAYLMQIKDIFDLIAVDLFLMPFYKRLNFLVKLFRGANRIIDIPFLRCRFLSIYFKACSSVDAIFKEFLPISVRATAKSEIIFVQNRE